MVTYYQARDRLGKANRRYLDSGKNPPFGVMVTYCLKEAPKEEVKLTFLDDKGLEIKSFSNTTPNQGGVTVPAEAGMNHFVWDLRYPNSRVIQQSTGLTAQENPSPLAPLTPPGTYQVRLTVGDHTDTESFEVLKDPRIAATQEDLLAQFELE